MAKTTTPLNIMGDVDDSRADIIAAKNMVCLPNLSDKRPKKGFPTTSPIP